MVENCIIIERLGEVGKYLPFYQFSFRNGIGSSEDTDHNYFLIDDPLINPDHIKIEFVKGKFYLYDLGSEHGTYFKPQIAQKLEINQVIFISENLRLKIQEENLTLLICELFDKKFMNTQSVKFEFSEKQQCLFFADDGKYSFNIHELKNLQFKIFFDGKELYLESIVG